MLSAVRGRAPFLACKTSSSILASRAASAAVLRNQLARNAAVTVAALSRGPAALSIQAARRELHTSPQLTQAQAAAAEAEAPETSSVKEAAIGKFSESKDDKYSFANLAKKGLVDERLISRITNDFGYQTMTEVQAQTIEPACKGIDMIAQAKTGTGKTLAFVLPVAQKILQSSDPISRDRRTINGVIRSSADIRALIISPTRELAEQIGVEAAKICAKSGIIVQTAVGGAYKRQNLERIHRQGCHILVGTPGRLNDLLSDPDAGIDMSKLESFVLDEADNLLDQGFQPQIEDIARKLPDPAVKDRQSMMFSATMPVEVQRIARSILKKGFKFIQTIKGDEAPTHESVPQYIVRVRSLQNLEFALFEYIKREVEKGRQTGQPFKALVFFSTTKATQYSASLFQSMGSGESRFGRRSVSDHPLGDVEIVVTHGKLTQGQRTNASHIFRTSKSGIMFTSDVSARGMDFPGVTHVIQVGTPNQYEQYIHRVGRTARGIDHKGTGVLFLTNFETQYALKELRGLKFRNDLEPLKTAHLDVTAGAGTEVDKDTLNVLSTVTKAARGVHFGDKAEYYKIQASYYCQRIGRESHEIITQLNEVAKNVWGLQTPPAVSARFAAMAGLPQHLVNIEADRGFGGRRGDSSRDSFGSRQPRSFGGGEDSPRSFGGGDRSRSFGSGGRDGGFGDRGSRGSRSSGPSSDDPFAELNDTGSRDSRGGGFRGGSRGGASGRGGSRTGGGFGARSGGSGGGFGGRSGGSGGSFGGRSGGSGGGFGGRSGGRGGSSGGSRSRDSFGGGDRFQSRAKDTN